MTDSSTNPFILPGMGQSSNLSGNPLLASMEMMKQAWAGLTGPGGLAQALPMTAPMNVEELERRIADLRAVEGWLRMNLSMLGSTIQGMEVQRATIATLRSFIDSAASIDTGSAPAPGQPTPLEIVLGIKPAPQDKAAPAASSPEAQAGDQAAPGPEALDSAARSASQAWWSLMQQQFNNIAQATVASMSSMASAPDATAPQASAEGAPSVPAGGAPRAAEATAAKTAKPAAKKTAARKTPARKAAPRKTAAKPAADKT
ncbi:regulatory protein [Bordetella ansorpii]|uniref:Regulatory protein n=1 Tax=Bordetella ansorpii TaxID=288768 RepID=A0A157S7D0_9BORD|nr:PhaM family polyhydroxyalkanoate granule multifunctional regulatory protein [Bordetella ansorpii]SAI66314.1 regulatory protein [Bordetella ansorpii]